MKSPVHAYILCSNPRSGTTLLCDLLAQTGVAGKPDSFFREKSLQDWCDAWGILGPVDCFDPEFSERYMTALKTEGRGDTPTFGMRLLGPDLAFVRNWMGRMHPEVATDRDRFVETFGATDFIHLSRTDKLAEAVSYLRAEQTGLWHQNPDGSAKEQIAPSEQDGYDAAKITARVKMLTAYDRDWEDWFDAQGIAPLRISYEALAADPQQCVAQILVHIGQDPARAQGVKPGVRKLADDLSAAWIARYRETHPV